MLNLFISVIPPGYDYREGYRFIGRLTKDWDQALIYLEYKTCHLWATNRD